MKRAEPAASVPAPRSNPHLVGHERAERLLLDAARGARLHHAWLICGPRGIGKATLAFRFARWLLAGGGTGPGLAVSADSPAFRRVASGGHADLLTIERPLDEKKGAPKAEIPVDAARTVGSFLARTAAEGGWRIVVVDAIDEMTLQAANAILKVLEEPPPRAILLLVCHRPRLVLPTVRSRCCRLDLDPLGDETVASLIHRYLPSLDEETVTALTGLAGGSIGRALNLLDAGGIALAGDLGRLLAGLPKLHGPTAERLCDAVGRSDGERAFSVVTELLLAAIADLARSAAVSRHGRVPAIGGLWRGREAAAARLAAQGGLDRWLSLWENSTRLLARADDAGFRRQVLLTALLSIEAELLTA